jgi:hypothetical protein
MGFGYDLIRIGNALCEEMVKHLIRIGDSDRLKMAVLGEYRNEVGYACVQSDDVFELAVVTPVDRALLSTT